MRKFEGKTSLVTGAGQGIGWTIAAAFAKEGATVLIADINAATLKQIADKLEKETGARVIAVPTDVTKVADCDRAIEQALQISGRLDILVNNAGITKDNLVLRMKEEDFQAVLDVNLKGAFLMTKAASRSMLKQRSGRVINIASIVGETGNAGQANYAASKAGLIGMTKAMAREFASRQVLVNAVAPGYIQTPMTDALKPEAKDALTGMIPLGRLGLPADVSGAVLFLAGPEADYITGQVISVNGGMKM